MLTVDQQTELQTAVKSHLAGGWGEAEEAYRRLLAAAPDDFQVNHLFGALRHQQHRPAEALPLLERACRSRPLSAPTHMCRGLALATMGRKSEAEKCLLLSLKLGPDSQETLVNLAAFYVRTGRLDRGIEYFGRALKLHPDSPEIWTGLGSAFHFSCRAMEAIVCQTRALELDPKQAWARFARAQSLLACHCVEEAIADFDAHLALRPDHHEARSFRLFALNYRDNLTREELAAEHLAYGRAVEAKNEQGQATHRRERSRLRLGFISPDFRFHSVAFFIEPILAHLDREKFEVVIYHDHYSFDGVSRIIRGRADLWRDLGGLPAGVVERTVREDAPDILVDLAGHTGFNRLELFARRLAPVQVTYLGYPNTTGLRAMDFRFTDGIADPVGETEHLHTEKLVRFAPTAWAYSPPVDAPDPARTAEAPGRPVVFGSFNALSKLNASTLRLWKDVLDAVPGSRLVLKSHGMVAERWRPRLEAAGIDRERVRLDSPSPGAREHLAAYREIDVALDPFPYEGTTTTCEALWMGVPVVTLAGDRHAARVGASLLAAVGRSEWVAATRGEYVRTAERLAGDIGLRERLRGGLRDEMRRSALLDHAGQAARFGDALRACWQEKQGVRLKNLRS